MAATKFAGLSGLVRELRIHLCQRSNSSSGTREFIDKHYVEMKKGNPQLPILIRECSGVKPKLYARFDYGHESNVSLSEMTCDQVLKALDDLQNQDQQSRVACDSTQRNL